MPSHVVGAGFTPTVHHAFGEALHGTNKLGHLETTYDYKFDFIFETIDALNSVNLLA